MKIKLFRAFPDPFRHSMLLYADQLEAGLRAEISNGNSVHLVKPSPALLSPPIARYFSQYVCYQTQAFFERGDINHITDHAYGHLTYALNPSKTIVTFHDAIRFKLASDAKKTNPGFYPTKRVMKMNLRGITRAAFVICDSEASRKDLIDLTRYPRAQTEVIPLGVDETFFESPNMDPKKALSLPEGAYLLHVGHVGDYKNIPALFHVLHTLKEKGRGYVRLLKAGMDFSAPQKQLARDLDVEDQILHLGRLSQEQLRLVYHAADILLFPSLDEGFGFPVLEAMASKLPVIAAKRGSVPEILAETGVLLEPDDYSGMAESVVRYLEDEPFRQEKSEAAFARAKQYSWQRTVTATLRVYKRLYETR